MRELFVPLESCVFRMGSGEQSQVRSQGRDDKLVMKLLQKSLSSFRALWAGLWSPEAPSWESRLARPAQPALDLCIFLGDLPGELDLSVTIIPKGPVHYKG